MARHPMVLNVAIRTRFVEPTAEEQNTVGGKTYAAIASLKITPLGRLEYRSYGPTRAIARRFAQGFLLDHLHKEWVRMAENAQEVEMRCRATRLEKQVTRG